MLSKRPHPIVGHRTHHRRQPGRRRRRREIACPPGIHQPHCGTTCSPEHCLPSGGGALASKATITPPWSPLAARPMPALLRGTLPIRPVPTAMGCLGQDSGAYLAVGSISPLILWPLRHGVPCPCQGRYYTVVEWNGIQRRVWLLRREVSCPPESCPLPHNGGTCLPRQWGPLPARGVTSPSSDALPTRAVHTCHEVRWFRR